MHVGQFINWSGRASPLSNSATRNTHECAVCTLEVAKDCITGFPYAVGPIYSPLDVKWKKWEIGIPMADWRSCIFSGQRIPLDQRFAPYVPGAARDSKTGPNAPEGLKNVFKVSYGAQHGVNSRWKLIPIDSFWNLQFFSRTDFRSGMTPP